MPEKHVSLWHPWLDKRGRRHTNILFEDLQKETQNMDINSLIEHVATRQLYVFVNDIISEDIPYNESLLLHANSEAFISKTGKVVALQVKQKNKRGFFIPTCVWGHLGVPDEQFLKDHATVCGLFNFEALTPSSLSEKVLRSTLPARTYIYRPTAMLRQTFLDNSKGGRIDEYKGSKRFSRVYEYDKNKAYLSLSCLVPTPYRRPEFFYYGDSGYQSDEYMHYATYWGEFRLIAHCRGIHPIQIDDAGIMREPVEGEVLCEWLWKDELEDCIASGYTLLHTECVYVWDELSDFMEEWSDILWEGLHKAENDQQRNMIKKMMVGLPGRFLKQPVKYDLIHESQYKEGDEPVLYNWLGTGKVIAPWFIRPTDDVESAQLTFIGHYILMKCRQDIWRKMKEEEKRGNNVLGSYIDCYVVEHRTKLDNHIGKERGQFKEKIIEDVVIEDNKIIPYDKSKMRAPSFGENTQRRDDLWRKHHGTSASNGTNREDTSGNNTSNDSLYKNQ